MLLLFTAEGSVSLLICCGPRLDRDQLRYIQLAAVTRTAAAVLLLPLTLTLTPTLILT
jgi:hypothetical protein